MLKSEVLDFRTKTLYNISYFDDDTIDTVRHHIAIAMNTHPDRLFIMVSLKLKHDYYEKDPRRWEDLFDRLSYNGNPIEKESFQEYQLQYRSPETNISYSPYDRSEWMMKPESLAEFHTPTREFTELRIFGVEEKKSYILPLEFNSTVVSKIPAANLPQPLLTDLVCSSYDPKQISRFVVIPYDSNAENSELVYFPYLRSNTPNILSDEIVSLLEKNRKLLKDLLEYEVKKPTKINVQRARLHAEFVETDFGSAVRTRFEQIFYGMTLSEEVPYIGFFTGRNEVMRHKFYVKETKREKKPFLDLNTWKKWDNRKPSRNLPTLVLFRGTGGEVYDRIAITNLDITMTFYRDDTNTNTIDELKREGLKWLKQFDALETFLNKNDVQSDRWSVEEIEVHLKYFNKLERIDTRRLNCVSFLFNQPNIEKPLFNFLRTDRTNYGISPVEIKIIRMMEDGDIKPTALSKELGITVEKARTLIEDVQNKLDADPSIKSRAFRNYPVIQIEEKTVVVSFVTEIDRIVKYVNLLRYITSSDESKLDKICPKRLETIRTDTGSAPVHIIEVDEVAKSQFGELFGFLEGEEEEEVKEEQPVQATKGTEVRVGDKRETMYSYFKQRLDSFDRATFKPNVKGFKYTKECEYKKQPTILSERDLRYLEGQPYDPRTFLKEKEMMNTYDPDGLVICPEYWCMKDLIPLTEELVDKSDGQIRCPECGGKLRTSESDDPIEFSLIKRDPTIRYPGYIDYKNLKNGELMPCCSKTPRKDKTGEAQDKYYVNRENIANLKELRVAFLTKELLSSLQIDETYDLLSGTPKRLQTGMSAFFRVGMGRPSQTLPEILQLKIKVPTPLESIETVLKCSFLRTWKQLDDFHIEEIENKLNNIPPFNEQPVKSKLAKIISGIHSAFMKKELSILEELEYTCLFLQCDVFRIYTSDNTLGCLFYSPIVKPRTRGIVVLQTDKAIDILCHVTRLPRGFEYRGNVFVKPFKTETYTILEKLRNKACQIKVPSFSTALNIARDVLVMSGESDFQVILDPFGRAQAFFIPRNMFIPFQPTSTIIDMTQPKIMGYSNIDLELYPSYDKVKEYLEVAKKYNETYEIEDDLYNSKNQRVEVLLKSGLRIPIYPDIEKTKESLEVIETTNSIGEPNVVFGEESQELRNEYSKISYASEIYEFLLYELTYDLQEEYHNLRSALSVDHPKQKDVEPLLKKWFEEKVEMTKATSPVQFISKIRKPCGQFKTENTCSGNLCAWNDGTCKVEVKQSVRKDNLFYRVLTTLIENSKIRAMILDGRTTPFFSTILYLEMPNELILTSSDIVNI